MSETNDRYLLPDSLHDKDLLIAALLSLDQAKTQPIETTTPSEMDITLGDGRMMHGFEERVKSRLADIEVAKQQAMQLAIQTASQENDRKAIEQKANNEAEIIWPRLIDTLIEWESALHKEGVRLLQKYNVPFDIEDPPAPVSVHDSFMSRIKRGALKLPKPEPVERTESKRYWVLACRDVFKNHYTPEVYNSGGGGNNDSWWGGGSWEGYTTGGWSENKYTYYSALSEDGDFVEMAIGWMGDSRRYISYPTSSDIFLKKEAPYDCRSFQEISEWNTAESVTDSTTSLPTDKHPLFLHWKKIFENYIENKIVNNTIVELSPKTYTTRSSF